jgi:hypothetical protein
MRGQSAIRKQAHLTLSRLDRNELLTKLRDARLQTQPSWRLGIVFRRGKSHLIQVVNTKPVMTLAYAVIRKERRMELVLVAIVAGAAVAVAAFVLLWRAVGHLIDWVIYTFGNERAANETHWERSRRPTSTKR